MTCTACRPTITRPLEESSFERKNPETIDGDGALSMTVRFVNKETGEIREQTVFMGDFPMMTEWGTFIINGTERVIV